MAPHLALACPFPDRVNPYADEVSEATFAWLIASGMVVEDQRLERLQRQKTGWLAARTNPEIGHEMLRLLSDWYMWLFALDDCRCDESELGRSPARLVLIMAELASMLSESGTARRGTDAYGRSLAELRDRVREHATPGQLFRWDCTVRDYLFAQVWEAGNREIGRVPGLGEYLAMRRSTGATYTCISLIAMAGGYEVPVHETDAPAVRRINDLTADLVSWDNDIFSYDKEKAAESARHNLIGVLIAEQECGPRQALRTAVEMHDQAMSSFCSDKAALGDSASPELNHYMSSLGQWLRGHISWSQASSRF